MAKVYESDVDPDDFIRSFREEPSGVSSLKKKPADNTEDKNPETSGAGIATSRQTATTKQCL